MAHVSSHVTSERRPLRRREQRALRRLLPRKLLVLTVQGGRPHPAYGIVNDISDSGAGIVADQLLPSGRTVRLRICLYPDVCYDTEARVVWGRSNADAGVNGLALNGLQFAGPMDLRHLASNEILETKGGPAHRESPIAAILEYLKFQIPNYPFSYRLDSAFIEELIADFPDLDILEEVKTFRWYHDSDRVAQLAHPRAALRRWVATSTTSMKGGANGNANGNGDGKSAPGRGTNGSGRSAVAAEGFRSWVSFLRS